MPGNTVTQIPPVQYARSADGLSIAYGVRGEGPPLTVLPFHISEVQHRWSDTTTFFRGWAPGLVEGHRVVSYDSRGQGLSTRHPASEPTIESYRLDLEAVLEAVGFERSVLVAYGGFAHVALKFAIEQPDRVDALALICTCESFSAWPLVGMKALAEENWELFVDLIAAGVPADLRPPVSRFVSSTVEAPDFVRMMDAFSASNVAELLPEVRVPTLILHSLDQHWLDVEEGKKFAAAVPGAQLVFLDGGVEPNCVEGVRAIRNFLSALGKGSRQQPAANIAQFEGRLTERQSQVLALVTSGKTNREIATELVLSERTVERHIADLFVKLGVRNRAEAVGLVLRR